MARAGLSELFIFTDDPAAPPACLDASARLGWSAVCVGRCGTGYHFLGAMFHGVAGSGDVVQHDPVGDSNTMELAAVLWALVWVMIFCSLCSVCIATDCSFSSNVAEALWSAGGHAQLACLCSPLLAIARQITDVRFGHVKAHEGNPFNELADGLAKRAAGGFVAPLPTNVSSLLVCSDSVTWEWLHGLPPETRGAYPPLRDGSFVFPEVRSSVVPGSLVKHVANDVVDVQCSTGVCASVHFGYCSFNVCILGDSGSRSRFLAGRPALIRRQVRGIGINTLGVQEARVAAGSRPVDGYVVLASGADRGTRGCELCAVLKTPMPVLMVKITSSASRTLSLSVLPRGSWWPGRPPGACSVRLSLLLLLLLLLHMPHIRAMMLPSAILGGRICHAGLQANLMLCCSSIQMLGWALLCRPLLAVAASASRRTL